MRRGSRCERGAPLIASVTLSLLALFAHERSVAAADTRVPTSPTQPGSGVPNGHSGAAPAASGASTATSAASLTSVPVAIETFDCFPANPDGAETAGAPGLSTWKAGGPSGAAWNAEALVCKATVRTNCDDGQILSELRIGKATVVSTTLPVRQHAVEWRAPLKRKQWEKNLDEPSSKTSGKRLPYRTGAFRLTATLTCRSPYELGPGVGPRMSSQPTRCSSQGLPTANEPAAAGPEGSPLRREQLDDARSAHVVRQVGSRFTFPVDRSQRRTVVDQQSNHIEVSLPGSAHQGCPARRSSRLYGGTSGQQHPRGIELPSAGCAANGFTKHRSRVGVPIKQEGDDIRMTTAAGVG